jgi:Uma2 family endonuclease
MGQAAERQRMTVSEYLAFELVAPAKHEYAAGEVFAMAGASPRHNAIVANLVMLLGQGLLGGPCRVFPSDLKIYVPALDVFTYPDVSVVCGELAFYDHTTDVITNPSMLIEVLSDSTERYDRGDKALGYRQMPSVSHHLLVPQLRPRLELYSRQPDGSWLLREAGAGGSVTIASIGISLASDDVFRGVFELPG